MVAWQGGDWCGAAVPTMMETVAMVQRRRNILQYPHSNYLQLMECEGGGICNVMVEEGGRVRCIKIFSEKREKHGLRTPYFIIGWLRWR